MSENSTESNGTVATANPEDIISQIAGDPELLKQLAALKVKDDERKAKLQKAAEERKRTNARGKMPDGTTDRNATQAYLLELGGLLTNWVEMYSEDPTQLMRRLTEQLIPSIVAMSNTASVQMATAQDTRRHDMHEWRAPHKAKAPAAPAGNTK